MSKLAHPTYTKEQYRDATRFDGRVRLYQLYAISGQSWPAWLFRLLRLAPGESILELGCGTGNVWRENWSQLPTDLDITLSDLSWGMLQAARQQLAPTRFPFRYLQLDAQRIPFAGHSFDVILANHMLYHVPDRHRALAEAYRLLKPGGRLYGGTNDWTHLQELRELVTRFQIKSHLLPVGREPGFFDLEVAAEEIAAHFTQLRLHRRHDRLEITEVSPLLAYVRSTIPKDLAQEEKLARLARHAQRQIGLLGSIHVTVSVGVIEALKP